MWQWSGAGTGGREVLEWPYTEGGGGVPCTPPPPTKVTIVGKKEIYHRVLFSLYDARSSNPTLKHVTDSNRP